MSKILCDKVKFYKEEVAKINESAKIVVVSKNTKPEFVNIATDCGLDIIGENRVQEFLSKEKDYSCKNIHFIGHLQSNKVKSIIDKVDLIQSVDSVKIAKTINDCSEKRCKKKDILIQINVSFEDSKSGIFTDDVYDVVKEIQTLDYINIRGFMTIPKKCEQYELETYFDKMNEIFTSYKDFDILSMGMTQDFKLALKHGSTMVRIGSGLFKDLI